MSRWPMVMASLPRSACRSRASCHAVIAMVCAGRAWRAASAMPSISARCMRSAERGIFQSDGADAVTKPRVARTRGAVVPSAGPKPLSRRMSRRKAARTRISSGCRGRQTSRPSTVRQARSGTVSVSHSRASHATETRSSSAEHTTASTSPACGRGRRTAPGEGAAHTHRPSPAALCAATSPASGRGVLSTRIRHNPCGVDSNSSSSAAVAAKPWCRAHAAVRPNASSSNAASASTSTQSCPRPMIGAKNRNMLPVPAPRSTSCGRLGSSATKRRARAKLRAA